MEKRTLELVLVSAKDLKNVNLMSKMDVYAVVSLLGDNYNGLQKTKTKPVREGDTNPTFYFPMRFTVDNSLTQQNHLSLEVKLVSDRTFGDRVIGIARVPVKELFDSANLKVDRTVASYQVRRPSGRPQGELSFSYKFGEKVAVPALKAVNKGDHVTAYPIGAPSYGAYPQQATSSSAYAYPPPPQQRYAYPPGQQVQQKPKKKKSSGMGVGTGLAGGFLGGLILGDLFSSAGCGGGGCGGGGCGGGGCGGGCCG